MNILERIKSLFIKEKIKMLDTGGYKFNTRNKNEVIELTEIKK